MIFDSKASIGGNVVTDCTRVRVVTAWVTFPSCFPFFFFCGLLRSSSICLKAGKRAKQIVTKRSQRRGAIFNIERPWKLWSAEKMLWVETKSSEPTLDTRHGRKHAGKCLASPPLIVDKVVANVREGEPDNEWRAFQVSAAREDDAHEAIIKSSRVLLNSQQQVRTSDTRTRVWKNTNDARANSSKSLRPTEVYYHSLPAGKKTVVNTNRKGWFSTSCLARCFCWVLRSLCRDSASRSFVRLLRGVDHLWKKIQEDAICWEYCWALILVVYERTHKLTNYYKLIVVPNVMFLDVIFSHTVRNFGLFPAAIKPSNWSTPGVSKLWPAGQMRPAKPFVSDKKIIYLRKVVDLAEC